MALYRFKARSVTPGQYRLAATVLQNLIALADIRFGVGRGDGGIGTATGLGGGGGTPGDVTPAGMLSLPLANLRAALSNCAAFQTWVNAADAATALASIGLVERVPDSERFAVVDDGDEFNFEALDSGATFFDQGSLVLLFQGPVSSDYAESEVDAQFEFTNSVGAILEDLWAYCGNNRDVFALAGMSKLWGPARPDSTERASADYMQMGFSVKWR